MSWKIKLTDTFFYYLSNYKQARIREWFKKKVENSIKGVGGGGGSATADFPLRKKNPSAQNNGFLHNNHFKTHLLFLIFGWGGPFSA